MLYKAKQLLEHIESFKSKRILVIGDTILDKSVFGTAMGLSLESPTLKGKKEKTEYFFGGAANVVENIIELGGKCTFITLIGDDPESGVINSFKRNDLELFPIIEKNRMITVKERHWMNKGQMYKVLQWDQLDNREISTESVSYAMEIISKKIKETDLVLLVDYRHGMMSKFFIDSIIELSKKNKKPVIASSQVSESVSNHKHYQGVDMIVMNKKEAQCIEPNFSEDDFTPLSNSINSNVCVTLGERGSILNYEGKIFRQESIKSNELDPCGAGDSFLAALALAGFSDINNSLQLANIWAGLSVNVHGAKPPKKEELINYLKDLN